MPVRTVKQLKALYASEKTSIGIVKPAGMIDIEIEPIDPEWKPEWQALFKQFTLFGDAPKGRTWRRSRSSSAMSSSARTTTNLTMR